MLEFGAPAKYPVTPEPRFTGALSTRNSYSRIVTAARELLLARPRSTFTIQEIATATRLSRRALYNHFPNPEALYRASLRALLEELGDSVEIELAGNLPPERAIDEFVRIAAALLSS